MDLMVRSIKLVLHYSYVTVTQIQVKRGQHVNNQSGKTIFNVCTIVPDLEISKLKILSAKSQNKIPMTYCQEGGRSVFFSPEKKGCINDHRIAQVGRP